MADLIHLLWLTVWLRPYVFGYFAAYALSGAADLGLPRLALFTLLAYALAWLSEYSSIHNGFPYGLYRYHHATLGRELWVGGVPFFDSLSYTFLAYASLCAALGRLGRHHATPGRAARIQAALLGGLLMLLQDVVVDPVAVRGSRWFLGDLFDYPHGGAYFGVPLSNFGGWFLTGTLICAAYLWAERRFRAWLPTPPRPRRPYATGTALYFTIMAFNVALAFYIGEPALGVAGAVVAATAAAAVRPRRLWRRPRPSGLLEG